MFKSWKDRTSKVSSLYWQQYFIKQVIGLVFCIAVVIPSSVVMLTVVKARPLGVFCLVIAVGFIVLDLFLIRYSRKKYKEARTREQTVDKVMNEHPELFME